MSKPVMHFIPIGRAVVDPIDFEEARCWAIFGKASADTQILVSNDFDRIRVLVPNGDVKAAQAQAWASLPKWNAIRAALISGELITFTTGAAGQFLRVPRQYWFQHGTFDGNSLLYHEYVPEVLRGAPILADPAQLDDWIRVADSAGQTDDEGANSSDPAVPPPAKWKQQSVTAQQTQVFKFFDVARGHLPGGDREPMSRLGLRKLYLDWSAKQSGRLRPYGRTGFEKMLDRYIAGWRVSGRKWELSH